MLYLTDYQICIRFLVPSQVEAARLGLDLALDHDASMWDMAFLESSPDMAADQWVQTFLHRLEACANLDCLKVLDRRDWEPVEGQACETGQGGDCVSQTYS